MKTRNLENALSLIIYAAIFYLSAYTSVSGVAPTSTPLHHDDFTNYAAGGNEFNWSWIRPLSSLAIYVLDNVSPEALIWAVRLLTVLFAWLTWRLLCQLTTHENKFIFSILFAIAAFSTPVIAEYARYTGMITHLMSGVFGVLACHLLIKGAIEHNKNLQIASAAALLLSILAKEDFILLYAFTAVFVAINYKDTRKNTIRLGALSVGISLVIIGCSKFLAASRFLGDSSATSTYYMDVAPGSITVTVFKYLTGAGHPSLETHGILIFSSFAFSAFCAVCISIIKRQLSTSAYGVGATLAIIAPYSVLPNHVNAYYEFLWVPFIAGTLAITLLELTSLSKTQSITTRYIAPTAFAAMIVLLSLVDYPGRKSIANWYDVIGGENAVLLNNLVESKTEINATKATCVTGAGNFSPWYMHSGKYLSNVLDLHSNWILEAPRASTAYQGLAMGAALSGGSVALVESAELFPENCLTIKLK